MSLPSHVFPILTITTAPITIHTTAEDSTTAFRLPEPVQMPLPDSPPPPTRAAFVRRLKLKHHHRSHLTYDENYNHDDDDDDDDHYGDDETEREPLPGLSPCSSKSTTPETQSPILPADDDDGHHDDHPHRWILSAARDEELKEWEQYLVEAGENHRLTDARRTASSASWNSVALSCGVMLSNSPTAVVQ
jgi:hypothetical protein